MTVRGLRRAAEACLRILFSCLPGLGHLHPLLPLARACRDAGHEVRLATGASLHAAARAEGFAVHATPPDEIHPFVVATFARELGRAAGDAARAPGDRSLVYRHAFAAARLPLAAPALRDAAAAFGADLLVHDPAELAAPLAAAQLGVPHATVGFGLLLPDEVLRAAEEGAAAAWRDAGLRVPGAAGVAGRLYLDPVPASMQAERVARIAARRPVRPAVVGAGAALPVGADQYDNAAAVAACGAGLSLPPEAASEDALREAALRLLDEPSFARVAASLAEEVAAAPSHARAVELLEALVAGA